MKIELPDETISNLVYQVLKDDYDMLVQDIQRLKDLRGKNEGLLSYQEIDLENNKKFKKAIKTILRYYKVG